MDFPKSVPNVGLVNGKFADENQGTGQPGSLIPAVWGNSVTDEILNVVAEAGEAPAEADNTQLKRSIIKLITDRLKAASETVFGVLKLASQTEVNAGADDSKAVTPKKYKAGIFAALGFTPIQQGGGIGQLLNKIYIGFDGSRVKVTVDNTDIGNIVTDIDVATEAIVGVSKVATQAEVTAGADDRNFVTSKKLKARLTDIVAQATELILGGAKVATQAQTNAGADDSTFVTPKKYKSGILAALGFTPIQQGGGIGQLGNKLYIGFSGARVKITVDSADLGNIVTDNDTASEAVAGVARRASQAEVDAGSTGTAYVAPSAMRWGFQFIVGLNGAIVFPTWMGGFILQWGALNLNDGTSAQVTFPVQFVSSRLATWSAVNMNIASWAGTVPGTSTSGGTNTLANMIVAYNDNGGITGVPVAWFALGK